MPHIVMSGPVDLEKFFSDFRPEQHPAKDEILKLKNIFMARSGDMVLIEALTVEGGPPNSFMIEVRNKNAKTTVRIYPGTDPEKTPGLKKLLARVARQIKDQCDDIAYDATNLKDYLL